MDNVNGEVWRSNVAGNLAKVISLDDGKPLLLSVTPKENRRDLAFGRIGLGLPHPFLRLDLLATLDFTMEWEISTNHITTSALWVASVLLRPSGLLPSLLAQIGCKLALARRTLTSGIYRHRSSRVTSVSSDPCTAMTGLALSHPRENSVMARDVIVKV